MKQVAALRAHVSAPTRRRDHTESALLVDYDAEAFMKLHPETISETFGDEAGVIKTSCCKAGNFLQSPLTSWASAGHV